MQNSDKHQSVSAESLRRKHEPTSPAVGWIVFAAGVIVLLTALCLGIVAGLMGGFSRTLSDEQIAQQSTAIVAPDQAPLARFPEPNLQVSPRKDLEALRAREEAELNTYGWVDRESGVVRIPIERAMDLVLERGLPARQTNQPVPTGKSSEEMIRERSQNR